METHITIPGKKGKPVKNYLPPEVTIHGFYSIDEQRRFIDGPDCMKFCEWFEGSKNVPPVDLYQGFDLEETRKYDGEFIPMRSQENSRLTHLLQWIRLHRTEFERERPDFVALRGLLRVILLTPYRQDPTSRKPWKKRWTIGAVKSNGTVYLFNILDENDAQKQKGAFWLQHVGMAAKFDQLILTDEPTKRNTTFIKELKSSPLASTSYRLAECRPVLRTQVGNHTILYSGELDAVCAQEGVDPLNANPKENLKHMEKCHMVEVKTSRVIFKNDKFEDWWFKTEDTLRWWTQCVLGGVTHLLVGYRNQDGILQSIENIPTEDLCLKYAEGWLAETGFHFMEKFLTEVKDKVRDENKVYVFSFAQASAESESEASYLQLQPAKNGGGRNSKIVTDNKTILKHGGDIQLKFWIEENSIHLLQDLV